MKLIIGLGNPDKKYQDTWHNVGFLLVDQISQLSDRSFPEFKNNKKFKSEITETNQIDEKIILAKPQTFMNNSGQAVKALVNFYKVKPADLWVIHDDIDLPLGKIRISHNSSAAGHKGVQSIIDQLGSQEFIRFRLGIQSEKQGKVTTEDYVLQKIDSSGKIIVNETLQKALAAVQLALMEGVSAAMNQFN